MSALKIIQAVGRKIAAKKSKTPEGITQIQPQIYAESEASNIAQRLVDAGLPLERFDEFIFSEADVVRLLNQIKALEKKNLADNIRSGIRNTESAKVFDLKGKRIKNTDNIMGGEEMPPPGSRGGDDDIAAPFQSQEETLRNMTEAEIKANLEKQNKDSVKRILERKNREDVYGIEDYDTTNMSEIKKEIIRTETKLGNLNPNNPGFRERANVLINKIEELKKKLRDDKANGGRIGLKGGTGITDRFVNLFGGKNMAAGELGLEGLNQLYQLLQMPGLYAKGGRAGFFMGSQFPKGLAALRQMLNYYGKKSDKVKNPSDILRIVNPKRLNTMLDDPNIYRKFDIEKGLAAPEMVKILQKQMMGERKKTIEEMLGSAKNIKKLDDDTLNYKNDMIEDMMKKGIDRKTAEKMADTITEMAESAGLGKFKDTPKLTDEAILELENILKNMETGGKKKRDLNADGGRIGLKDGMNRRTFLKLLGGLASIPIIGKIIKPLKTVKGFKNVPIIKTDNVPGKPEWFDQLVNKVIIEGDDVTKKLATVEREIVHTKKINDTDEVTVYQDLNTDSVRVEYNSPNNMMEEQVDLSYKRTPPDEGAPRGDVDFEVTESGFVGRADGPDDFFIDAEEVGGSRIKDLDSDVSALKEYATGKKQTLKEFVQSKKRKDKVKKLNEGDLDAQSEYIVNRQGDYVDYDDYASGGIARMLGE